MFYNSFCEHTNRNRVFCNRVLIHIDARDETFTQTFYFIIGYPRSDFATLPRIQPKPNPKFSDYHWWWRSFIVGGGSGFYVLLYSVFYFFTKLEISSFVPCLLYFGYTCLITITFSCFTGTVSFYSSYIFINKIYGQIKID